MSNSLFGKDIVTIDSLGKTQVEMIYKKAKEMGQLVKRQGGDQRLQGKIVAATFYEPSTRTFSSFITAAQRLGAGVIPLNGMSNTSVTKGETLEDTVRVFSQYADLLVIRHPVPGSVTTAAEYATIPVINAGDGVNEHPTQALIDSFTIRELCGPFEDLHILMIGDLAHYRPTNSLAKLFALYPNVRLSFATPKQVPLPDTVRQYLRDKKVSFNEYSDFSDILPVVDVLYVTRVKKEYMSEELYKQVQGSYVINSSVTQRMKKKSIIMHCLPRVGEIATEVDNDSRAVYLKDQLSNGLYLRMALLDLLLRKQ